MAITVAKKPIPAAPAKTVPTPMGHAPAPQLVAAPAVVEQTDVDAEPAEPKEERLTRKDFATHEEFCDYKIGKAQEALERAEAKVKLWQEKKLNKDADVLQKKEKKAEKLLASYAQTLRDLGVGEAAIQAALTEFQKKIAAELAGIAAQ